MNSECPLKCGKTIHFEEIQFKDGFSFSIPCDDELGTIHDCEYDNLEHWKNSGRIMDDHPLFKSNKILQEAIQKKKDGDLKKYKKNIQKAITEDPGYDSLNYLSEAYKLNHELEDALIATTTHLRLEPNQWDSMIEKAQILTEMKKEPEAIAHLKKCIENYDQFNDPEESPQGGWDYRSGYSGRGYLLYCIGLTYLSMQDSSNAKKYLELSVAWIENNNSDKVLDKNWFSKAYYRLGGVLDNLREHEKSLEMNSKGNDFLIPKKSIKINSVVTNTVNDVRERKNVIYELEPSTQDDHIAILEISFRNVIMDKFTKNDFKNRVDPQSYESAVNTMDDEVSNVLFIADEKKHRLIDYYNFGALMDGIFKHKNNYEKTFQPIFGNRDIFYGYLTLVVQLRNPIEHHRGEIFGEYINQENVILLKKAYKYFIHYIKEHEKSQHTI